MNEFSIPCEDIVLRLFRPEDLDDFHAITHEPEIVRYLPGWNADSKDIRADWLINYEIPGNERFLEAVREGREIGDRQLRLVMALRETGAFIGWVCTSVKEELPPPNREIMYGISAAYSGKGYATQAASGMIGYLFGQGLAEELNAIALTHNAASNRVIVKCGFQPVGDIAIDGETYHHYKLLRNGFGTF
ncbi:GNAT family N-acetyltransferase [Paenibacillus rhizovicinus]|uniref:GNAT family N-acetyltransferase n=1 Tax=Paenibacillus rhizovicinus TaxID=2704463 RepID=A0A6C0P397_9BACL|nr:GNAT family N-acetyltransferase [Paenibacillus rhizovicinus]QHW32947.1 GNAT family N-acetyltransferase [Paenibacillus rhizovicinus]